jgi:hypothetical protein
MGLAATHRPVAVMAIRPLLLATSRRRMATCRPRTATRRNDMTRVRRFALTAHVTASVGWLGAVAGVLALAIAGVTSEDAQTVRAAYIAMDLTGWYVLVPLALASFLTGLVQSLVTNWGLFRHYWVLAKLLINVVATVVLLMYTQTLGSLADMAAETTFSGDDLSAVRSPSPVLHAGVGLLLLLAAVALAVYKPRGMTPYGWRKQHRS